MRIRFPIFATLAATTAGVLAFAGAADAHNRDVASSCLVGVVVNLTQYDAAVTNTVKVSIDATTYVDETFGSSYSHTVANPDKAAFHTWSVVVTAGDGAQYGFTQTGSITACAEAPTTTTTGAPPSTIPATTPSSSTASTTTSSAPASSTTSAAPSTTPTSSNSSPPSTTSTPAPSTPALSASSVVTTIESSSSETLETSLPTPEGVLIHVDTQIGTATTSTPTRLPATGVPSYLLLALAVALMVLGGLILAVRRSIR